MKQVNRPNVGIGIEFEGDNQPEDEGIRKTRALMEKYM